MANSMRKYGEKIQPGDRVFIGVADGACCSGWWEVMPRDFSHPDAPEVRGLWLAGDTMFEPISLLKMALRTGRHPEYSWPRWRREDRNILCMLEQLLAEGAL